ncbi:MAG: hypothetical protein MH252_18745 [Thermosynechococcaceae cyanobacterium MS004]|nr:hypothetical protein [Thermosynechococcaceae cyanobacterium MS004]
MQKPSVLKPSVLKPSIGLAHDELASLTAHANVQTDFLSTTSRHTYAWRIELCLAD